MELFPVQLMGDKVRLDPMSLSHLADLLVAANEQRDTFGLTTVPPTEEKMRSYIEKALVAARAGNGVPFVTVDRTRDRVVGSTRFCNLERWDWSEPPPDPRPAGLDAAEIGFTWLAASAQRTFVNNEAKLLMLTHAFETWKVRRMNLKTDARNLRSRTAIERIGGKFDGVLRCHMPAADGGARDTAYFSILESEWPEVKAKLAARSA